MKLLKSLSLAVLATSLVSAAYAGPFLSDSSATNDLRFTLAAGISGQHYGKLEDKVAAGAYTASASLHYSPLKAGDFAFGLGLDGQLSQGNYTFNANNHTETVRAYTKFNGGASVLVKYDNNFEVAPFAKVGGGYVATRFDRYKFEHKATGFYGTASLGLESSHGYFIEVQFDLGSVTPVEKETPAAPATANGSSPAATNADAAATTAQPAQPAATTTTTTTETKSLRFRSVGVNLGFSF